MSKCRIESNIKAERIRKGMTQVELSKLLGISANSYIQKETGRRQFTLKEFRILCEILECNADKLI